MGLDQRIGKEFLRAGAGFGGSCLPKDLRAFICSAREHRVDSKLLEDVLEINISRFLLKNSLGEFMKNDLEEMEFVSCNFCQSNNYKIVCTGKDFLIGSNTQFNVVRCKICGLLYTNPRPKPATISKYYPKSYSNFLLSNRFFNLLRYIIFWNELNLLSSIIRKSSRVLEIGCGTGEYLSYLKHKGYEVEGIELSKYCIDTARNKYGLNIKQGTIFDYKNKENYFDLIIMRHVLEHVPEPLETIKTIYKMLKENGTFFCLVPNTASYDAKIFKQYWRGFELPRHYFHYEPKVLKKSLNRKDFIILNFFIARYLSTG